MNHHRRAFTLIELLVVFTIVGILVALLLPAVQSAREAARRKICTNHLRQISLGMQQYHDLHGSLPPGKKGCCWGTWLVFVLPQIEQDNLYNCYNFAGDNRPDRPSSFDKDLRYFGPANRTVTSTRIETYLCPSDSINAPVTAEDGLRVVSCTSQNYAVNFGNVSQDQLNRPNLKFGGAPFTDVGSPLADRGLAARPTVSIRDVLDGTSQTLLASEVIVGQGYDLRGFSWWGDAAGFEAFRTPNSSMPDVMVDADYCRDRAPNPPCTAVNDTMTDVYAARSRHTGGVNASMIDGSVRFVKDSIDPAVWQAISTTSGGEVVSTDSF